MRPSLLAAVIVASGYDPVVVAVAVIGSVVGGVAITGYTLRRG